MRGIIWEPLLQGSSNYYMMCSSLFTTSPSLLTSWSNEMGFSGFNMWLMVFFWGPCDDFFLRQKRPGSQTSNLAHSLAVWVPLAKESCFQQDLTLELSEIPMRKTSKDYCQGETTFFFGKVGSMSQRLIVDYVNVWCLTMLWMFGKTNDQLSD